MNSQATVKSDPDLLQRILGNLLSNAIRHSPPRGEVQVVVRDGPQPTVEVLDQGPGFADDFVDRAFDQFVRADEARDRAHGGAGLGLAVVKGLAEAQEKMGRLVVETRLPSLGMPKQGGYEGEGWAIVRHEDTAVVEQAVLDLVRTVRIRYA